MTSSIQSVSGTNSNFNKVFVLWDRLKVGCLLGTLVGLCEELRVGCLLGWLGGSREGLQVVYHWVHRLA